MVLEYHCHHVIDDNTESQNFTYHSDEDNSRLKGEGKEKLVLTIQGNKKDDSRNRNFDVDCKFGMQKTLSRGCRICQKNSSK